MVEWVLVDFLKWKIEVAFLTELELLTALTTYDRATDGFDSTSCAFSSLMNHQTFFLLFKINSFKIKRIDLTEPHVKTVFAEICFIFPV